MSSSNIYGTRANGGQHGDVFTKPEIVGCMLNEVGYVPSRDLSKTSIMEPSCGEGEFIIEILTRLKASSEQYGFDFNEAFHCCVFASDIDERKVKVCIERIATRFPELSDIENNVVAEDYLLSSHCLVDIIVGNPPYIRYEEIPADKLEQYKQFPTFYYRADIYVPFFEKSLSQLKPNGKHCFICSNRWMRNQYGKLLRKLIARYYNIEKIINMESADAFQEEVLAYPAITVISNQKHSKHLLYAEIADVSELTNLHYTTLASPKGEDWSMVFNAEHKDLSFIEDQDFKIGIGVATGADGIFVSRELKGKVEDELLLPAINAKDLSGDKMVWSGRYFLNPYDKNGQLIHLDRYPKAKAYLEEHKEKLSSRHKAQKNPSRWYGTIDAVSPTLKSQPKILLPDISGNTYVFVDEGSYYPQHNIYYITGRKTRELRILAAILMSDFVRQQLDNLTNHMNGGYARWQSQYLRKLHVPTVAAIPTEMADKLLKCYDEHNLSGINYFTTEILLHEKNNPRPTVTHKLQSEQLTFTF